MLFRWALTLLIFQGAQVWAWPGGSPPKAAECKAALSHIATPEISAEQKAISALSQELIQKSRELQKLASDRLEPYVNPFLLARNQEQVEGIITRLSRRADASGGKNVQFKNSQGGVTELTYGAQLNAEIRSGYTGEVKFNKKLLELLVADAEQVIMDPAAKRVSLYDISYALRRAEDYLARFIIYDQKKPSENKKEEDKKDKENKKEEKKEEDNGNESEDGKPSESQGQPKDQKPRQAQQQKPQPKKDQKKQEGKEDQKDQKPKPTEQQDAYKPHTKDMTEGKDKNKKFLWGVFYGDAKYFKDHNFNIIDRHSATPFIRGNIPLHNTNVASGHGQTKLLWNTYGEKKMLLSLPHTHRPLQPLDGHSKITQDRSGSYFLETDYEKVEIPMLPIGAEEITPELIDALTSPVGFKESEWPDKIQSLIKLIRAKKSGPRETSQMIVDFFHKNYKYSLTGDVITDPVQALNSKGFQCDMAAYSMVSLLRDVFKIPSRAVGGYPAHSIVEGGQQITKLMHSGSGDSNRHAWVEAIIDNKWVTFDPTPIDKEKSDKKDQENSDETETSDESQQSDPSQTSEGQGTQKKSKTEENKKAEERKKEIEKQSKEAMDKIAKEGLEDSKIEKNKTLEDLKRELKTGSLTLKKDVRNPLVDRVRRIVLKYLLNPTKTKSVSRKTFESVKNSFFNTVDMESIKDDVKKILDHRSSEYLYDDITKLAYSSKVQELNKTYFEIFYMLRQLELFSMTLDLNGRINKPTELMSHLKAALDEISKLNMSGSQEMAAVREFYNRLPNVTRSAIRDKFKLSQVGPNAPTKAIASSLKSGNLFEYQLLGMLRPYTDFILDSEPVKDFGQVKSQNIDLRFPRGRDLIQVKNPLDIYRQNVINLKPLQSRFESFMTGDLYIFRKKEMITVPLEYGSVDDMERVTFGLFDLSGSMSGDPEIFQAAMLGALVDNAASDVSPSGRQRHQILLMGFDENVHPAIQIKNKQDALNLIKNFKTKLKNNNAGTDIQGAILEALAGIAAAQGKSNEPLKKANIIVFTDGQANIDFAKIEEARRAIDTRTKIDIMFVAINGSNPDLQKVAYASEKHGMNKGYYIEFNSQQISDFITESKKIHLPNAEESFFTQDGVDKLSPGFFRNLENAQVKLHDYSSHVDTQSRPVDFNKTHREIEEVARKENSSLKDVEQTEMIKRVREVLYHNNVFLDKNLKEDVISDLLENYYALTGQNLSHIGSGEATSLMHLIEEFWSDKNAH